MSAIRAATSLSTAGICVSDPRRCWTMSDELFLDGSSSIMKDSSGAESKALGSRSKAGRSISISSALRATFRDFQLLDTMADISPRPRAPRARAPRAPRAPVPWHWEWPRGVATFGPRELHAELEAGTGTNSAMATRSVHHGFPPWLNVRCSFLKFARSEAEMFQLIMLIWWVWLGAIKLQKIASVLIVALKKQLLQALCGSWVWWFKLHSWIWASDASRFLRAIVSYLHHYIMYTAYTCTDRESQIPETSNITRPWLKNQQVETVDPQLTPFRAPRWPHGGASVPQTHSSMVSFLDLSENWVAPRNMSAAPRARGSGKQ